MLDVGFFWDILWFIWNMLKHGKHSFFLSMIQLCIRLLQNISNIIGKWQEDARIRFMGSHKRNVILKTCEHVWLIKGSRSLNWTDISVLPFNIKGFKQYMYHATIICQCNQHFKVLISSHLHYRITTDNKHPQPIEVLQSDMLFINIPTSNLKVIATSVFSQLTLTLRITIQLSNLITPTSHWLLISKIWSYALK